MAQIQAFSTTLLFLYLVALSLLYFTDSKPVGFSLKMIPRDSPESPLYPGNLTEHKRIQRLVRFSKARADYLESISTQNATLNPENIRPTVIRDDWFYMVQLGIGTPSQQMFLLMDTGGGLSWTQCEPCNTCFPQTSPIYDPGLSNTYRKLPCDHILCDSIYECVDDECVYDISYGDVNYSSSTEGVASFETFKFKTNNNTFKLIDDIIFGCSYENHGFTFVEKRISGIMGLSTSRDSLITQLRDVINGRFSYCLVYVYEPVATSFLRFGDDIVLRGQNVQHTPFVPPPPYSDSYYLNLIDISVGYDRMGFPPGYFRIREDGTGGCIIDSGAGFSYIHGDAYGRVREAFIDYFLRFNLQRAHERETSTSFNLCYIVQPSFKQYPAMTFHFQGADLIVDPKYMYYFVQQAGFFCLALFPGQRKTILGAWQQQNTRFVYDINVGQLTFVPENCANDRV